ncbi:MAG: hypothetical protein LKJ94_07480 [Candidatus Methanomethylophilus sp.]|jgi:hypothetical protein|nr:hypothetical protein [Methanomethylophilus sp.]MCI2075511.1 hypothetical protein [Methanomethylophilus sp.]MCI2093333.1 hypothetical protein [Methanomethylophilus sp.]
MNGPKLIAEIIAAAVIIACGYGIFSEAVPSEYPPIEISTDGETTTEISGDGMNVGIKTQSFLIDSHMPSDIEDVSIELSLATGGGSYYLGTIDVGTVKADAVTRTSQAEISVPAYVILASLGSNSDSGEIKTPVLAKLSFSYLTFMNEKFIDLGLNLRVDMGFGGEVSMESSGDSATMTVTVPDGSLTESVSKIAESVCDSSGNCAIAIDGCDAAFNLNISGDGKTVTFTASGSGETAYSSIRSLADSLSSDGTVRISYSGSESGSYEMTQEQAEAFADMIEAFYGAAS